LRRAQEGMILTKIESVNMKFKAIVDIVKCAIRTGRMEVAKAVQETACVFRIMIFLHSAKDFPSVLRLYGIEGSPGTELKTEGEIRFS
jgi:hypothetical protein